MRRDRHKVKPEHFEYMKKKYEHLNITDEFLSSLLQYPFFFVAQQIENNTSRDIYLTGLCKFRPKPKAKNKMNVFQTLRAIYDASRNLVIKDSDIEELARQRIEICRNCPIYSCTSDLQGGEQSDENKHETCSSRKFITKEVNGVMKTFHGCGCDLKYKTRYPGDTCPIGNWSRASINVDNTVDIRNTTDVNNWQNQK